LQQVKNTLRWERQSLEKVVMGSHLLGELSPMGYDVLVSEGERMCVPILAGCLGELGIDAVGFGGDEAGICTDNNYGSARPDEAKTRQRVRDRLLPRLKAGQVPVVAGFYGQSPRGRIAILGRGGSDYSATLLGCALDADEIWIMTDVTGIKTCDPRFVPDAQTLPILSYEVAAEMALLGAKVLHGKCAMPAALQNIPIRIANTFEPHLRGTYLTATHGKPSVAAITVVRNARPAGCRPLPRKGSRKTWPCA
jgi:aspartate kinase